MGATGPGGHRCARATAWERLTIVALLIALVGGGCATSTGSPPPPTSGAPSPGGPGTPTPDLGVLRDVAPPIASIVYSEDPASALVAIVDFGPNSAGLAGMEIYRSADGSGTVVGYDTRGGQVIISLDPEGRPAAARADDGGRVEIAYTADTVEITVVDADGTTERETGPITAGLLPAPGGLVAGRATLAMAEPTEDYPLRVRTSGTIDVKTTRRDGKPIPEGTVGYVAGGCVPSDADVDCVIAVRPVAGGARVTVTSTVRNPVAAVPGLKVWRTRDECDAARASRGADWRHAGTFLAVVLTARTILSRGGGPARTALVDRVTAIAVAAFVAGQGISYYPNWTAVDCRTAPNLENIRLELLDNKDQVTVAVSVAARPTTGCEEMSPDSLRIRESQATVTVTPFIPSHRSPLATDGSVGPGDRGAPLLGSAEFVATTCTIEMTGAFDVASLFKAMPLGGTEAAFKRFLGENRVTLSIEPSAVITDPSAVTGDFVFTLILPDSFMWRIHDSVGEALTGATHTMPPDWYGCRSTLRIGGTMTGTNVVKGAVWIAEGKAKATSSGSLEGCEATGLKASSPEKLSGITWLLKGDATRMNGRLLIPNADGGPTLVLKVALTTK
jgi:hypothetical protein